MFILHTSAGSGEFKDLEILPMPKDLIIYKWSTQIKLANSETGDNGLSSKQPSTK